MAGNRVQEVDLSIERLRTLIDWTPYVPTASAPGWLTQLSESTITGVGALCVLAPSGVSVRRKGGRVRPALDPATILLLGLAEAVTRRGTAAAIGIPPDASHLPLLLAAAEVLRETLASSGRQSVTRRGVLLVSPDLELRSRYPDLVVRNEGLDLAHPGSRMRPDGVRLPLRGSGRPAVGGVCFYLPNLALPARIDFPPALVLVDLRLGRL